MSDRRWRAKNTGWLILILVLLCYPTNWIMMKYEVGVHHKSESQATKSYFDKMDRAGLLLLSPIVVPINCSYILAELAE